MINTIFYLPENKKLYEEEMKNKNISSHTISLVPTKEGFGEIYKDGRLYSDGSINLKTIYDFLTNGSDEDSNEIEDAFDNSKLKDIIQQLIDKRIGRIEKWVDAILKSIKNGATEDITIVGDPETVQRDGKTYVVVYNKDDENITEELIEKSYRNIPKGSYYIRVDHILHFVSGILTSITELDPIKLLYSTGGNSNTSSIINGDDPNAPSVDPDDIQPGDSGTIINTDNDPDRYITGIVSSNDQLVRVWLEGEGVNTVGKWEVIGNPSTDTKVTITIIYSIAPDEVISLIVKHIGVTNINVSGEKNTLIVPQTTNLIATLTFEDTARNIEWLNNKTTVVWSSDKNNIIVTPSNDTKQAIAKASGTTKLDVVVTASVEVNNEIEASGNYTIHVIPKPLEDVNKPDIDPSNPNNEGTVDTSDGLEIDYTRTTFTPSTANVRGVASSYFELYNKQPDSFKYRVTATPDRDTQVTITVYYIGTDDTTKVHVKVLGSGWPESSIPDVINPTGPDGNGDYDVPIPDGLTIDYVEKTYNPANPTVEGESNDDIVTLNYRKGGTTLTYKITAQPDVDEVVTLTIHYEESTKTSRVVINLNGSGWAPIVVPETLDPSNPEINNEDPDDNSGNVPLPNGLTIKKVEFTPEQAPVHGVMSNYFNVNYVVGGTSFTYNTTNTPDNSVTVTITVYYNESDETSTVTVIVVGSNWTTPTPTTITFNKDSITLGENKITDSITATVKDQYGNVMNDQMVRYILTDINPSDVVSGNTEGSTYIMTADITKLVAGGSNGSAKVTAKLDGYNIEEERNIVILAPSQPQNPAVPTTITLDKNNVTLSEYKVTDSITATVKDQSGFTMDDQTVTFTLNNVSPTGVVSGTQSGNTYTLNADISKLTEGGADGSATITVSLNGCESKTCSITITAPSITYIPVTSVLINNKPENIYVGNSRTLTATIYPTNASDQTLTWSSSNPNIVSVNSSTGEITGVTTGTCTISVTAADNNSDSFDIESKEIVVVPTVSQFTVTGPASMTNGETAQFTPKVVLSTGTYDGGYIWSSSDTNVATVNGDGLVTAVGAGDVEITALMDDGYNYAVGVYRSVIKQIHVIDPTINPERIDINPDNSNISIYEGEGYNFTASVYPNNATPNAMSWTTNDNNVASVITNPDSTECLITGQHAGNCKIIGTITGTNITKEINVTVIEAPINPTINNITLNESSISMQKGTLRNLIATVDATPNNSQYKEVTWSSSDSNIASVYSNGLVNAISLGTVTITATSNTDNSKKASCTVTVVPIAVTDVELNKESTTIIVGDSELLTATVYPQNADNKSVVWNSSNSEVASVDNTGLVTANSLGTATITVTTADGNKQKTCQVTTEYKLPSIVNPTGVTITYESGANELTVGQGSGNFTAVVTPDDAQYTPEWSISNDMVAHITPNGDNCEVIPYAPGTATLKITVADGIEDLVTITVSKATIPVTGISVDPSTLNLTEGDSDSITTSIIPSNATNQSVTYESDDEDVATVNNNGVVTAVSSGQCTIIVTSVDNTNVSATCDVYVKEEATVNSVSVNGNDSVTSGQTSQYTANIIMSDGSVYSGSKTWSVTPITGSATINSSGLLTAGNAGTVSVKCTANGISGTKTVTITSLESEGLKVYLNFVNENSSDENDAFEIISFDNNLTASFGDIDSDGYFENVDREEHVLLNNSYVTVNTGESVMIQCGEERRGYAIVAHNDPDQTDDGIGAYIISAEEIENSSNKTFTITIRKTDPDYTAPEKIEIKTNYAGDPIPELYCNVGSTATYEVYCDNYIESIEVISDNSHVADTNVVDRYTFNILGKVKGIIGMTLKVKLIDGYVLQTTYPISIVN